MTFTWFLFAKCRHIAGLEFTHNKASYTPELHLNIWIYPSLLFKELRLLNIWTQAEIKFEERRNISRWNNSIFLSLLLSFPKSSLVSVLQSLIPDIKINQEAVVELHPEELQLSGDEENLDANRGDPDKGLKIRRTVTQVRGSMSMLFVVILISALTEMLINPVIVP